MIDRIQKYIDHNPGISRVQLSRGVCGILGWRTITGKLKEMSCRVALLKLESRGVLRLPAAHPFRHTVSRPQAKPQKSVLVAEANISCGFSSLGPVHLVRIDSSATKASRQWNTVMDQHHYLGSGPLCGAQIRYLIQDGSNRILGGLSFSASAYSVSCRDAWIGWNRWQRRENLQRVICNSRFLILPSVRVPHLASHVLGMVSRRIAGDWQNRYGYAPLLLETYVDHQRFKGTSYRASNWKHVGMTTGRSRQDRKHTLQVGRKDVFIFELHKKSRALLCVSEGPVAEEKPASLRPPPGDWAEEEFGASRLGEQRLEKRLLVLARDFWAKPQAAIPQACGSRAKTKAAYRFFDHRKTVMEDILKSHYEATAQRIQKEKVVLAVQDTTQLNYAGHLMTQGLGPVGTKQDGAVGLFVHDTLAVTPDGTPLGLLDVQCWARDGKEFGKRVRRHELPIEKKESWKWIQSYRAVEKLQRCSPETLLISVGDREADIYELFASAREHGKGPHVLVRARQSRMLAEGHGKLWSTLQATPIIGNTEVMIPRRGNQPARKTTLEVRFMKATLQPPHRKRGLGQVTLWAVAAKETSPPEGIEPVEWLLLTTKEVGSSLEAVEILTWYSRRWGIEVYHRTLKSGCKIEERQLGSSNRIEACLAIDMVVAWRIYFLVKMGRETPDVPCTVFFEDYEWKALVTHIKKNPENLKEPPSLREAVRMIASLGGFLGRKCDGEPGTKTTWLGLQCLDGISLMFKYMAEQYAPHLLSPSVSVNSS